MAEIEIKRGYEVLPDNRIRFGVRVTNNGDSAISEVEVILDYNHSLFELEGSGIERLGTIPPSNMRTVRFILKPLGCVHNEKVGATVRYKDHKWENYTLNMQPKEVHCVYPFLKEKTITRTDFLKLFNEGYAAERGLNFENIHPLEVAEFITHTCKNRLYRVDEFSIKNGKILYLAADSIGQKAHYLLTAVVIAREGIVQVLFRAKSDKESGINGFLNEIVENLSHLVQSSSAAREIGIIKREQVINIIDSVVVRPNFGSFEEENGKKIAEEKLRSQQEENERLREEREERERLYKLQEEEVRLKKAEEERLRKEREEQERKRKETEEKERFRRQQEEEDRTKKEQEKQQQEELCKQKEEEKRRKEKEAQERKQREEQEGKRREQEEKVRKKKEEQERLRIQREETERKAPYKKSRSSSGKGILVFSILFGVFLIGAAVMYLGSNNSSYDSSQGSIPISAQNTVSPKTYAYIANFNSSTVSVIDTATNIVTATVDFRPGLWNRGRTPLAVAVTPDRKKVFLATCQAFPSVSVIDTVTNKITATVDIDEGIPTAVAVTPDGKKVYVACSRGTVFLIDTATNNITATVNIGGSFYSIAVTPDGKSVYIGNSDSEYHNISVIDTATNDVKATLTLDGCPLGIAVSPNGKNVYVTVGQYYSSTETIPHGNVSIIDTATNTVTSTVPVGKSPNGIAVSPDGKKLYVANYGSNTVSIIDTSANSIADTVNVGAEPEGVAITPDGKKVYVTNKNSNTVSVIDIATNSVIATVPVGQQPRGIAIG